MAMKAQVVLLWSVIRECAVPEKQQRLSAAKNSISALSFWWHLISPHGYLWIGLCLNVSLFESLITWTVQMWEKHLYIWMLFSVYLFIFNYDSVLFLFYFSVHWLCFNVGLLQWAQKTRTSQCVCLIATFYQPSNYRKKSHNINENHCIKYREHIWK